MELSNLEQKQNKMTSNLIKHPEFYECIVLYLPISIALLTAWAFRKRSQLQQS